MKIDYHAEGKQEAQKQWEHNPTMGSEDFLEFIAGFREGFLEIVEEASDEE